MCFYYLFSCLVDLVCFMCNVGFFFFFKQKTAYEMRISDWSSDVCSSDLFMDDDDASHYVYGPREKVSSSLHGRVGTIPARLAGYGERWDGDECTLWCEGVVQQSTVFGEDLHLIRRIEATVGSDEIRLHDRVV